jgi:tetratricopeptide (TPR) repeat protein
MGAGLGRVFDMASICVLVRHPQPHRSVTQASAAFCSALTCHQSDLRSDTLKGFADELLASYHTSRSSAALEKAIAVYEEILRMRPAGHVRRAESLNDLGDSLFHLCSYHQADETRGTRCIELLREGLRLRPPGNPLRDQSLHNLARSLRHIRYDQLGSLNTLLECASLNREALRLRSSGHPQRDKSLNNLAIDLARIVTHTGDVNMMTEMIDMRREVVRMRPLGHPLRYSSLENLGTALYISFEITGSSKLLAEAIAVLHEAVDLCPCEHHGRYLALDELSNALYIRSVYEGNFDSLAEVVNLKRQALQLLHHPHPDRARVLGNLGESLLARFHVSKDEDTLAEAITLFREVMAMESPETRTNLIALNNLAEALEAKFDQADDIEALSEAVTRHREALHMKPIGHQERFVSLEGLAQVLSKSRPCSWPEALSCYQEALQLCPVGHPARSRLLSGMSKCFLDPESTLFSLSEGISCLSGAYADTFSHVNGRLKRAVSDLNQLEAAYLASKKVGHTGVSSHDDERVMDLYAQIIGLLPLAANFDLDHSARLQAVAGRDEIARNAAARALLLGCLPRAVEMLEQGRGVFWTQTLHFRTSTFDGVPREDCMELQRMLGLLEHGAHRVENLDQPANKREQELETRRQLNEAVQALITKIRSYPGLNRFLLPPAFDVLFGSLPDGFVVIVNASKLAPHALLLHQATRLATSLVLKPFRASLYSAELRTQLPRHPVSVSENNGENWTRAMRLDGGRTGCLEDVLSYLWTSTVQPILDMLGLNVSVQSIALFLISHRRQLEIPRTRSPTTLVVRDGRTCLPAYPCCWKTWSRGRVVHRGLRCVVVHPHARLAHQGKKFLDAHRMQRPDRAYHLRVIDS